VHKTAQLELDPAANATEEGSRIACYNNSVEICSNSKHAFLCRLQRKSAHDAELLRTALRRGLQPIRVQNSMPPLTAVELLDRQMPIVKPLVEPHPVPPIKNASQAPS